ncbi:hypothetical protein QEZ54_11305 [Catellatospora sp. KI3]|uniref:hypothetical protein n=1 Tax=Catellatospora sp. KI3 TaxID=3041620 RepID=UPI002482EE66|nr:hypothetical protein [Catellatospora sp. KI3]MDI1461560.1 hypothetical protein [Catellatospora sp. KI3]
MRPRPCDCTPMCVRRASGWAGIRAARVPEPSFAEASVYRAADPDGDDLAKRLTRYAVLTHDPDVRGAAPDYRRHSEPYYAAVLAELGAIAAADPATGAALRRLADEPGAAAERRLEAMLTLLLGERPELFAVAAAALRDADANVYVNYLRGPGHRLAAEPVGADRLWARASDGPPPPPPPAPGDADVLVVIPISDLSGTRRLRDLLACLIALRDQAPAAARHRVTVVEFDTEARWRELLEPLVDHYFHVAGLGAPGRSRALNAGVRLTPGDFRALCLLDGDVLADRWFLARNLARFDDPLLDAHLPHAECLWLDVPSSDRLIRQRCLAGAAVPPLEQARGVLLREAPGGCLWMRPGLFDRIGGFDETGVPAGGADEDLVTRAAAAGTVARYDDVLLRLAQPGPSGRRGVRDRAACGVLGGADGRGELIAPASLRP